MLDQKFISKTKFQDRGPQKHLQWPLNAEGKLAGEETSSHCDFRARGGASSLDQV